MCRHRRTALGTPGELDWLHGIVTATFSGTRFGLSSFWNSHCFSQLERGHRLQGFIQTGVMRSDSVQIKLLSSAADIGRSHRNCLIPQLNYRLSGSLVGDACSRHRNVRRKPIEVSDLRRHPDFRTRNPGGVASDCQELIGQSTERNTKTQVIPFENRAFSEIREACEVLDQQSLSCQCIEMHQFRACVSQRLV